MSYIPSQYLVRLQELKLWQGNYDTLLQKQKEKSTGESDLSDLDGLDGVTPLKENKPSPKPFISSVESSEVGRYFSPQTVPIDWDQQTILPTKPFNELLEEKLAEDKPTKASNKVKQPFLKKGAGLIRYKLDPSSIGKKKVTYSKVVSKNKQNAETTTRKQSDTDETCITPLRAPDFSIKCKATWNRVSGDEESVQSPKEQTNRFNPHYVIEKINEFAQAAFRSPKTYREADVDVLSSSNYNNNYDTPLENSFGNRSDKELHIFETLEEKVDHSSFLSTNTSIIKLLTSTPNSNPNSPKRRSTSNEDLNVCQELRSSDVLTKILNNLKLISAENANGFYRDAQSTRSTPNTSFFEDKRSSSQSPSSCYTEFESTLGKLEKINAGVNTSFVYDYDDGCLNCTALRKKLDKLSEEVSSTLSEKARLYDFGKELEKERDAMSVKMERLKENYDKDVEDLRQELEEEKQKLAREKALLDMYIKDVRPKKKDWIEVENVKRELAEFKELLKLKETKNGTTQARLRNQIKQLEKEKTELKSSVELLQKENAKLNATQKVHRNAEARMLQEISRNLNRLTEEAIRGDIELPNVSSKERCKAQKKIKRKTMVELKDNVSNELHSLDVKSKSENTSRVDNTDKRALSLQEIYNNELAENCLDLPVELVHRKSPHQNHANPTKKVLVEREFADGSKEIKFVNGTSKTISPDGNLIYIQYPNGDIRETNLSRNMQKYYFVKKNIWLTKFADGTEIIEFPNGQKEERFADGKIQVTASDGTTLTTFPEGTQEIQYPDGSKMIKENQEKIIYLPNGQKETHTPEFKKREYPDGTVKIIYPNGTQESRYANGRVRIKDENGTLLVDSHISELE